MKKIILQILSVFFLSTILFSQTLKQEAETIDEFGVLSLEDLAVRINFLSQQLNGNPNIKALVKISGSDRKYFSYPYIHGAIINSFLKNNYKVAPDRFFIQFCNVNNKGFNVQLVVLPANKKIEGCDENLPIPKETVLYENLFFYDEAVFSSKKLFEDSFIDVVSPSEWLYSQYSQNTLLKLLNKSPRSKIYLVGYLGTNFDSTNRKNARKSDKPALLNKLFREVEKEFIQSGINRSRIIRINGGYQDSVKNISIWFVPRGGHIPKPTADYLPKNQRK